MEESSFSRMIFSDLDDYEFYEIIKNNISEEKCKIITSEEISEIMRSTDLYDNFPDSYLEEEEIEEHQFYDEDDFYSYETMMTDENGSIEEFTRTFPSHLKFKILNHFQKLHK